MKSDEFIEWLHSVDLDDSEQDLEEVKKKMDEVEVTDDDNAFSDVWS